MSSASLMVPAAVVAEETPLLLDVGDQHYDGVLSETVDEDNASPSVQRHAKYSSASSRYILQLCIVMLIFDFTQYSTYAPLTAVFEEIICRNYYSSTSHPFLLAPRDCKVVPVQRELAIVKGYKDGFNQIPSIVLGIPLSLLADRMGRKPVILLFLFGIFLSDSWTKIVCLFPTRLPLRLVWLAPILKAIGGGANFGTSMLFTATADVIEEKDRVDAFLKLSAMEMIVQIAGLPLVSALMSINSWFVLGLSSILLVVAIFMAFLLPETHPHHQGTIFGSPDPTHEQAFTSNHNEEAQRAEPHFHIVRKLVVRSYATFGGYLKNPGILLSLAVFLLVTCGAHVWALLLQYVSQKFEWEFSTTNLLFSLRGCITLLLSLVIIPAIDRPIQQQLGINSAQKDLFLSMGSCILIIAGITAVGLAQGSTVMVAGVMISALGSSLLVCFRCAMIALFSQTSVAPLNAVAGMAQSTGILIAGPVLAATYSWGLAQGGIWIGAAFLLSSGLHIVALAFLFYLCLSRARRQAPSLIESHES